MNFQVTLWISFDLSKDVQQILKDVLSSRFPRIHAQFDLASHGGAPARPKLPESGGLHCPKHPWRGRAFILPFGEIT